MHAIETDYFVEILLAIEVMIFIGLIVFLASFFIKPDGEEKNSSMFLGDGDGADFIQGE